MPFSIISVSSAVERLGSSAMSKRSFSKVKDDGDGEDGGMESTLTIPLSDRRIARVYSYKGMPLGEQLPSGSSSCNPKRVLSSSNAQSMFEKSG